LEAAKALLGGAGRRLSGAGRGSLYDEEPFDIETESEVETDETEA